MDSASTRTPFRLEYRPYRRRFARPHITARGSWSVREGLLLKIENAETGMRQFGEVAPLPEFGTESLGEARQFMDLLTGSRSASDLQAAIKQAPNATAFGIWTAISDPVKPVSATTSALISLGESSPGEIKRLSGHGYASFKLKLTKEEPEKAWKCLQSVADSLSPGQSLRLDPNRSWNPDLWEFWKPRLTKVSEWIQYLEEPFVASASRESLIREAADSPVPLALDESLCMGNVEDWCKLHWPGYWIIKPSIMGSPSSWLPLLDKFRNRVILSSAFETGIGMSSLVMLSRSFIECIHGLGTQDFFNDHLGCKVSGAIVNSLSLDEQEEIWNRLSVA